MLQPTCILGHKLQQESIACIDTAVGGAHCAFSHFLACSTCFSTVSLFTSLQSSSPYTVFPTQCNKGQPSQHVSCYYTGDKPQAFVGSREWIGAIELGYVLDERLGVSAKVITVSSGAEMGSKARELAQHFDSQDTPVMVRLPGMHIAAAGQ